MNITYDAEYVTTVKLAERLLPAEPITDPVELIDAISNLIETAPQMHEQTEWFVSSRSVALEGQVGSHDSDWPELADLGYVRAHPCGTAACVGGWAALMSGAQWDYLHGEMVAVPGVFGRSVITLAAREALLAGLTPAQRGDVAVALALLWMSWAYIPEELEEKKYTDAGVVDMWLESEFDYLFAPEWSSDMVINLLGELRETLVKVRALPSESTDAVAGTV